MVSKLTTAEKAALVALHKKKGIAQKEWEAQVIAEKGREELAQFATEQIQKVNNNKVSTPKDSSANKEKYHEK
ncbi:hypothetical protein [Lactobacillus sp. ESL0681]|uniref:hypothetical protein n=1 Tax=Lactobacillus sp. ESL0681 TaxID=2983211 RepID=UPI0023F7F9A9|nr:hypothetical protein [Lactobacillus sp. ESL0681]WEV41328.1 hypothetical protein OZX59_09370 [Lactobacillus sp. ESL0681]